MRVNIPHSVKMTSGSKDRLKQAKGWANHQKGRINLIPTSSVPQINFHRKIKRRVLAKVSNFVENISLYALERNQCFHLAFGSITSPETELFCPTDQN